MWIREYKLGHIVGKLAMLIKSKESAAEYVSFWQYYVVCESELT